MVWSANARGVMPGTWDRVSRNLGVGPLSPTSAEDNNVLALRARFGG